MSFTKQDLLSGKRFCILPSNGHIWNAIYHYKAGDPPVIETDVSNWGEKNWALLDRITNKGFYIVCYYMNFQFKKFIAFSECYVKQ